MKNRTKISKTAAGENNISNENLLENGGRPLFFGRKLVESISRNSAQGDPWRAASKSQIFGWAASLRVLSEILATRASQNIHRSDSSILTAMDSLPIFFSAEDTHEWEVEKPWKNIEYGLQQNRVDLYTAQLESDTPYDAYQIGNGRYTTEGYYVWRAWLDSAPIEKICRILENSASSLIEWDNKRPNKKPLPVTSNTLIVGKKIGLNDDQCKTWSVIETLGGTTAQEVLSVWNLAMDEIAGATGRFFALWEAATDLDSGSICRLLSPDSPLCKLRFFQQLVPNKKLANGNAKNWAACWNIITFNGDKRRILYSHYDAPEAVFNEFLRVAPQGELPISAWSHLGNEPHVWKQSLCSGISQRILIWGPTGGGKSALAACLAEISGHTVYEPLWPAAGAERAADLSLSAVRQAHEFAQVLTKPILLIDECERTWNSADSKNVVGEILDKPHCSQIWIANDLTKCDISNIGRFDTIIEIEEMPREAREILAKRYFNDADLAFRVAQAMRNPASIIGVARTCKSSNDFSWSRVCSYMHAQTRAMQAAKTPNQKMPQLLKKDSAKPLVALAGNAMLEKLQLEIEDAFKFPQRYQKVKAKTSVGMFVHGPSGTGKTLFARHLAHTAGVPMLTPNTSDMASDPDIVRAVFTDARRQAPCILFLDEADVLLDSPFQGSTTNMQKQKIINTVLTELDGIHPTDGVLVIAATHRGKNIDPAVRRAGRLSRTVTLTLPTKKERIAIWNAHLLDRPMAEDVDVEQLAISSSGFSGAEIADVCNTASVVAAIANCEVVKQQDLLQACDEMFWGAANDSVVISEKSKRRTVVHEAGHAIAVWKNNLHVPRITARPRGEILGAVHWLAEEGEIGMGLQDFYARVEIALAGIVAEKVIFGAYHNGGTGDLRYAHWLLMQGYLNSGLGSTLKAMYGGNPMEWSESRKAAIEKEEQESMERIFSEMTLWFSENSELLQSLADTLYEKREISGRSLDEWKKKVISIKIPNAFSPMNNNTVAESASVTVHRVSDPK